MYLCSSSFLISPIPSFISLFSLPLFYTIIPFSSLPLKTIK
jgi:hypothetical protein